MRLIVAACIAGAAVAVEPCLPALFPGPAENKLPTEQVGKAPCADLTRPGCRPCIRRLGFPASAWVTSSAPGGAVWSHRQGG